MSDFGFGGKVLVSSKIPTTVVLKVCLYLLPFVHNIVRTHFSVLLLSVVFALAAERMDYIF